MHDDAGGIEGFDKFEAGAVHAGHFGLVDPDFAIVDLHSGQRCQNVLDHFDAGTAMTQDRAARNFDSMGHRGRNANRGGKIAANKHDSDSRRRRAELDAYIAA